VSRKPYRVEVYYPTRGRPKYYLVKDVAIGGKRRKVRKYLGVEQPTGEDLARFRREHGPWLEFQAVVAKARVTVGSFKSQYLGEFVEALEVVKHLNESVLSLLTISEVETYEKDFEISYIQGTTSIEGNTLSLRQAGDLLTNGIAPKSKTLREINEVQNFRKVIQFRRGYKGKVSLEFIKSLHSLIMANIDLESAGQFRRVDDVGITGCDLKVTPSAFIQAELSQAIQEYYSRLQQGFHPFEEAVLFHYKFEMIHPFTDGNGRVGREILNFMLMKAKYPRLLFLGKHRGEYIEALRHGNRDQFAKLVLVFVRLMLSQRQTILEERLRVVASHRRKTGQLTLGDFVDSG